MRQVRPGVYVNDPLPANTAVVEKDWRLGLRLPDDFPLPSSIKIGEAIYDRRETTVDDTALPDCPCLTCVNKRALAARSTTRTNPVYSQHNAYRQGDEYFCPRCGKRWPVSEDAPNQCS